ncbi:MAG: ABC transporter permease [Bacteroidales bacterium]|nr:ABC transporter permease [Bacteroidales bacterium]MBO7529318.1 ABC transporter permease [Bacteroidales bacterium]
MNAATFISKRIFSLSKENLSSTVMRIAVASVALGIAIMLISIAVVVGFKNQIRDKVIGFVAPIHIQALNQNESIEETPFLFDSVLNARLDKPFITEMHKTANKAGIIKTDEEIQAVVLKGVDFEYNWKYIDSYLVSGEIPQYTENERSNDVVISNIIAHKMNLNIGDPVRIWFVDTEMKARGRKFNVKGIYETGLQECDERFVYCDLNQIRRLNGWDNGEIGHLEIWVDNEALINEYNRQIYYSIPTELVSYSAMESYPQIFDWLELQDMNVVIIIVLMLLVAGITIISMLLIIILERTSTIGLLKAMGASNGLIRSIFLRRSCRILLIGMAIGDVIGIGLCLIQKFTNIISLSPESYYLSAVPIELNIWHIIILNVGTMILWVMMLLLPTMLINNVRPSKSIRFE